jgi:hypothetical protein
LPTKLISGFAFAKGIAFESCSMVDAKPRRQTMQDPWATVAAAVRCSLLQTEAGMKIDRRRLIFGAAFAGNNITSPAKSQERGQRISQQELDETI